MIGFVVVLLAAAVIAFSLSRGTDDDCSCGWPRDKHPGGKCELEDER